MKVLSFFGIKRNAQMAQAPGKTLRFPTTALSSLIPNKSTPYKNDRFQSKVSEAAA